MVKGKEFKKPHSKRKSHIQIPEVESKINYDLLKPTFSLKYIPYQGPYCISQCQENKKALIISKLLRLSQSTWQEIRRLPKEQGLEPMPLYRFTVPVPLPSNLTSDATILVARYDGDGGRLVGYRDKDIYHIVLVGRNLYPH